MQPKHEDYISITTLKAILRESDNKLRLIHPHKIWDASFTWEEPTSTARIREVENELNLKLPEDYIIFLTSISNGATLFYDAQYGQWGYKLYKIEELVNEQRKWRELLTTFWESDFFAIGKIIEEDHVLVMDLNKPAKNRNGCELKDGSVYDPPSYWPKMSRSFHEWLENLITAQGAKYWLWK